MKNPVIKWVLAHGHKVLMWIQFFVALILWITTDPDPVELLKALQTMQGGG